MLSVSDLAQHLSSAPIWLFLLSFPAILCACAALMVIVYHFTKKRFPWHQRAFTLGVGIPYFILGVILNYGLTHSVWAREIKATPLLLINQLATHADVIIERHQTGSYIYSIRATHNGNHVASAELITDDIIALYEARESLRLSEKLSSALFNEASPLPTSQR